jgi:CubicO group peptidase (beta-lactamase class C family)
MSEPSGPRQARRSLLDGFDAGTGAAPGGWLDAQRAAMLQAKAGSRAAAGTAPALAVGVFRGGHLAGTALRGSIDGAGRPPLADTAFRIASCTKSFTAAAVLILRDRGLLELDSDVAAHLPGLRLLGPAGDMSSGELPAGDMSGGRLTVRMLLTMSGGLPTDDPWADRLESMTPAAFHSLLRSGVRLVRTPGTAYEYSNLGYAMLGAVISRVTGQDYTDFVRDELLQPLGLRSTDFHQGVRAAGGVALGFCRRSGTWELQPFSAPGAFSAIGGLFSTVEDLGRWAAWLADGFADGPEAGAPLSRATRREMQQLQVVAGPERLESGIPAAGGDGYGGGIGGYGFGLRILSDPRWGLVIGHSGGYPGFSSHMAWHPASGTAVVGFENATYAKVGELVRSVLAGVLELEAEAATPAAGIATPDAGTGARAGAETGTDAGDGLERPAAGGAAPWPEVLAARAVVDRLVEHWEDELARSVFAGNVEQDESLPDRRSRLEAALAEIGPLRPGTPDAGVSATRARLEWLVQGTRGSLKCAISMTPEAQPKVQEWSFAVERGPSWAESGAAAAAGPT